MHFNYFRRAKNFMTRKNLIAFAFASMAILISACQTPSSTSAATLYDTEWVIHTLNNIPTLPKNHPSILFSKDLKIQGNASCNNYSGGYTLNNDQIKLHQLVSTQKACFSNDVMQQEQQFLKTIEQSETWNIQANGDLILKGSKGQLIASRK